MPFDSQCAMKIKWPKDCFTCTVWMISVHIGSGTILAKYLKFFWAKNPKSGNCLKKLHPRLQSYRINILIYSGYSQRFQQLCCDFYLCTHRGVFIHISYVFSRVEFWWTVILFYHAYGQPWWWVVWGWEWSFRCLQKVKNKLNNS